MFVDTPFRCGTRGGIRIVVTGWIVAVGLVLLSGCDSKEAPEATALSEASNAPVRGDSRADMLTFVLAPHQGDTAADREIIRLQERVRQSPDSAPWIERLGWAFVAKARVSFDPGFYRLAGQCADVLEALNAGSPEGRLLRGHILHQEHRFKDAEPLARQLATDRGLAADFGLLGDVLMEQGRLDEAVVAYQQMMDLRPDLHAYARGAHVRWLKGDLSGAHELMELAVGAASPQSPEAAAWVTTRLGQLRLQTGDRSGARHAADAALQFQPDYAPALLLRGRLALADDQTAEAIASLAKAARINPQPELQWALAESLRAEDRTDEAAAVESQLARSGVAADPRTYAVYLATRGEDLDTAVRLAAAELQERADVFTHDAVAWTLSASGKNHEAWEAMQRALAEGTQDPRLFFHAAIIARRAGRTDDAERWFDRASDMIHLLLPSERDQLLLSLAEDPNASVDQDETNLDPSNLAPKRD